MPQTANKGYEVQTTGSNTGTWGTVLNDNALSYIDQNLGGTTTLALSSSNVTLSTSQSRDLILVLTGTLLANVQITTACVGMFYVYNTTSGNFSVTITRGSGATVIPPQNVVRSYVAISGSGIFPVGLPLPGTLHPYGGGSSTLPAWLQGEYVLPDGSAISRTTYANLFAIYGTTYGAGNGSTTFNVPDLRGRTLIGLDNMGGVTAGRVTTAGSGISGTTLGAAGGAQSLPLAQANLPNVQLSVTGNVTSTSTHTIPDSVVNGNGGGTASGSNGRRGERNTTLEITTVSVFSGGITASMNGGVTQTDINKMPPAMVCNIMIKT